MKGMKVPKTLFYNILGRRIAWFFILLESGRNYHMIEDLIYTSIIIYAIILCYPH